MIRTGFGFYSTPVYLIKHSSLTWCWKNDGTQCSCLNIKLVVLVLKDTDIMGKSSMQGIRKFLAYSYSIGMTLIRESRGGLYK
jgi:hypothetical protein